MTAQAYEPFHVRAAGDHVEVEGMSEADVESAIRLYRAVVQSQLDARATLQSQVNAAFIERGLQLVSEASQKQIVRNVALREALLEEEGFETYATLAALRDSNEKATRMWAARRREKGELFTVELQGRTLIPAVQLTADGGLDAAIAQLSRTLLEAGLGSWELWTWLTSPTGRLSGDVPAQVVRTNAHRANAAAVRYADELRLAQDQVA